MATGVGRGGMTWESRTDGYARPGVKQTAGGKSKSSSIAVQ